MKFLSNNPQSFNVNMYRVCLKFIEKFRVKKCELNRKRNAIKRKEMNNVLYVKITKLYERSVLRKTHKKEISKVICY